MDNGFPRVRAMLSIHDEIIISADKSIPCEEIIKMIKLCMEIDLEGAPPFFVQPAYMQNWGEHSNDAVAMPIGLRDDLIEHWDKTHESIIHYDDYLDVLNSYREKQLKDYMEGLIQQYGTDYRVLGQHVRHPSLTFDLLEMFSRELKGTDLSHEEQITEASRLYLEMRAGSYEMSEETPVVTEVKENDRERFFEEAEASVNFDEYGEVIYDSPEDEDEEVESIYDDEQFINYITENKEVRAWELMDTICVDMTQLEHDDANHILQEVYSYEDKNGFYQVMFLYAGKTLRPGLHVEDIPVDDISDEIVSLEQKYSKNAG